MKILVVSHEFPPIGGGGANACYFITKGFAEKGHDVTLLTANYQEMKKDEVLNGVHIVRVNSKRAHKEHCSFKEMLSYLLKATPIAEELHKENHFDICLVFFGIPSGPIGYILKKKYKLPYVIRFGGGDVPGFQERFTKIYKILEPTIKTIWRNAAARVANSDGLKQMALDYYDKVPFEVICNGVDTNVFHPIEKHEKEEFQILFVSRLIERKGLQYIIPELRKIQESVNRKIRLIIVGDGPYRENLEQLADECKVRELVSFEGQKDRENVVPYYQNADLFILPSKKEGMPNVVLEAMACGLPIIMTPCEGSEELIAGNGYILNISEFGKGISDLLLDKYTMETCSKRSIERVADFFEWDVTINEYVELMSHIIIQDRKG